MRVRAGVGVEQFCRIKQHCFWNRRTIFEILHTKCLLLPSQVCLAYNDSCRPATSTSILQKKMCLWDQWIQTFLTFKCLICWGSRDAPLEWWRWQWDSSISTFFRVGRRWEHCSWWPSCKWESASLSDGHLHCFSMSIEKSLLVAWKDVQIGFRYLTDINCVCETEDSQMNFVCKETRLGAHLRVQEQKIQIDFSKQKIQIRILKNAHLECCTCRWTSPCLARVCYSSSINRRDESWFITRSFCNQKSHCCLPWVALVEFDHIRSRYDQWICAVSSSISCF